jgi:nitrate reductase NapAB chaperone NapD
VKPVIHHAKDVMEPTKITVHHARLGKFLIVICASNSVNRTNTMTISIKNASTVVSLALLVLVRKITTVKHVM